MPVNSIHRSYVLLFWALRVTFFLPWPHAHTYQSHLSNLLFLIPFCTIHTNNTQSKWLAHIMWLLVVAYEETNKSRREGGTGRLWEIWMSECVSTIRSVLLPQPFCSIFRYLSICCSISTIHLSFRRCKRKQRSLLFMFYHFFGLCWRSTLTIWFWPLRCVHASQWW